MSIGYNARAFVLLYICISFVFVDDISVRGHKKFVMGYVVSGFNL